MAKSNFPPGVENISYKLGTTVMVFSHGFGVDRTSNGLFNDIIDGMPKEYGHVLFDYYDVLEGTIGLTTFGQQQERLASVINWTSQQPEVNRAVLVAHSMGCIVAALLSSTTPEQVIMLAPPLIIGDNTRHYFTSKKGAYKDGSDWIVPRSTGITSRVSDRIFEEFEKVDAQAALASYAAQKPYDMIIASHDEVLAGQDYTPLAAVPIRLHTIAGADHNFSGGNRQDLINLLDRLLLE